MRSGYIGAAGEVVAGDDSIRQLNRVRRRIDEAVVDDRHVSGRRQDAVGLIAATEGAILNRKSSRARVHLLDGGHRSSQVIEGAVLDCDIAAIDVYVCAAEIIPAKDRPVAVDYDPVLRRYVIDRGRLVGGEGRIGGE
jgi:hypothetical protein